jgi:hypothetical protein
MKTILGLAAAAMLLGSAVRTEARGSAAETTMQSIKSQPAAEARAVFAMGKNDNTNIDLMVRHLAQPDKLGQAGGVYVVWTQKDAEAPPQNVGALRIGDDLTGKMSTVSPLTKFDLFITVEPNAQVLEPTGEKQLWTSYSR